MGEIKIMKINCPKCQFENQADSTRVVCARCATIIEVRLDQGSNADTNGKRQTARLPFGLSSGNSPVSNNQGLNDVYATRLGDDFDDVLDIPRPEQPSYQSGFESPSVYDDVFANPGYDSSPGFDYSSSERRSNPLETFRPGASRQRENQDFINESEPEFMGWPVLPDESKNPEGAESGYSSRDGVLTRIVATVLIFGVFVSVAYYLVSNRPAPEAIKTAAATKPATNSDSQKTSEIASNSESESKPAAPAEGRASTETARNTNEKPVAIPPSEATRGVAEASSQVDPAPTIVIPNRGEFTIQIGSFSEQPQANERAAALRPQGISANVVKVDLPGIGIRYRVYIGGFGNKNDATAVALKMRGRGIIQDYFVTTK
jgi:cell division septation protein DedD